jgi:hypothetical protein
MPPLYRVPAPPKDGSIPAKPILPVKYQGEHQGYATFNDGCYEFRITKALRGSIADGSITVNFDPPGDTPSAIVLKEKDE